MESLNKFSIQRTIALIQKSVMDRPKVFMMRMIVLIGSLAVAACFIGFVSFSTYLSPGQSIINVSRSLVNMFIFMFYVLGLVYTSMAFSDTSTKPGRIDVLMLPARNIEKYISRWIVYVPVFLIAFLLAMFVADAIRVAVMKIYYHEYMEYISFMNWGDLADNDVSHFVAIFVAIQSFFWLGSIMWAKNSFIKTFAAVTVLLTMFSVMFPSLYFLIIPDSGICGVPLFEKIDIDEWVIFWAVCLIVSIANYILAYMRLKETEVIQRLW
ncbi:MAG: hypothetical protein NC082_04230 [Clostridiales bacterium]|nr:hypothetical protein [Clostridiales bacterium]